MPEKLNFKEFITENKDVTPKDIKEYEKQALLNGTLPKDWYKWNEIQKYIHVLHKTKQD